MCGRFAFYQRPSEVRRALQDANMPADDAPDDDSVRQTYNFAPGYYGLIYRANTSDYGAGPKPSKHDFDDNDERHKETEDQFIQTGDGQESDTHYKLQAMKWGLIPSWTKRNPDYGSLMRTINCRDDSLAENRGMWINMKKRKRCVLVCHGFYEWLKKNNGKDRIPHYIKRKDGQMMCFAGLWDCVQYEGEENKNYTFTVITTGANKQIQFLHDRMPVILTPGSEEVRTWLDPARYEWSQDLQSLLRPWDGDLDIYPVVKDVGKVGNDSPNFIVPLDSKENRSNIANFFSNQQKKAQESPKKEKVEISKSELKAVDVDEAPETSNKTVKIEDENTESHAPLVVASSKSPIMSIKREREHLEEDLSDDEPSSKKLRTGKEAIASQKSPSKLGRKGYSSTSNGSIPKESPRKAATQSSKKITSFFGKRND